MTVCAIRFFAQKYMHKGTGKSAPKRQFGRVQFDFCVLRDLQKTAAQKAGFAGCNSRAIRVFGGGRLVFRRIPLFYHPE